MSRRSSGQMQWKRDTGAHRLACLCLVLACLVIAPAAAWAQTIVPGTLRLPGDSAARAAGDSGAGAGRTDSAGRVATGDSTRPAAAGTSSTGVVGSAPPQTVNVGASAPVDSTLARACAGMSTGDEAPGLLVVIFRRGTSDKDRQASAKAVGGVLAGTSPYGDDYVRLGPNAAPLPVMADRLIRQEPVMEVSPAPCP